MKERRKEWGGKSILFLREVCNTRNEGIYKKMYFSRNLSVFFVFSSGNLRNWFR